MTGWRIGYAGGPTEWIRAIRNVFTQSNGGPYSISQAAAVEALNGPQANLSEWLAIYRHRRDLALSLLRDAPVLECAVPEGAFYILPKCAGLLGRKAPLGGMIESSSDFCKHLIEAFSVVTVPGAGFFCNPYFRISFATSEEVIEEGCRRIVAAARSLS